MKFGYIPGCFMESYGDSIPGLLSHAVIFNRGDETVEEVMQALVLQRYYLFAGAEDNVVKMLMVWNAKTVRPGKKALEINYVSGKGATKALFPYAKETAIRLNCDRIEFITHGRGAKLAEKFGFGTDRHYCVLDLTGF